jgi:lipoate-protein ligase A
MHEMYDDEIKKNRHSAKPGIQESMIKGDLHSPFLLHISEGSAYKHLALEDYLFSHQIPAFLFYINDPVVIIGKHQNPWIETDPLRYSFARRRSGGGSVYHDTGNVNYSFIMPRKLYHRDKIFSSICLAFEKMDMKIKITSTWALTAAGKKFSGSAFRQSNRMVLHHGTLLVHSDLDQMKTSLTSPYTVTDLKSTRSNPAEVINLQQLNPALTTPMLIETLISEFKNHFHFAESNLVLPILNSAELVNLIEFHQSTTWRFGDWMSLNTDYVTNPYYREDIHEKAGISE